MADDGDANNTEWYDAVCSACTYKLPRRYQNLSTIGQGAFGTVVKALDTQTDRYVAIKKMMRPFQTDIHAKRTYRELKLLMALNHRDAQIVKLYDVFTPEKTPEELDSVYFVFNFVDYNLNQVIRRNVPFREDHIKQIIYSILRGLKYIHSAGIIHRDIKPENIGIDVNSNISILDFGLSKLLTIDELTGYVATRWWRAPEVIASWQKYDKKVDVWSVGCIMAELIKLQAIFRGTNRLTQLNSIMKLVGTPSEEVLQEICTPDVAMFISQQNRYEPRDFNEVFGYQYDSKKTKIISGVSPIGTEFLKSLLTFDPRQRPTVEEALAHPFLEKYHSPTEEPTIAPFTDEHQDAKYDLPVWKQIIWDTIKGFKPPTWIEDESDDDDDDGDDDNPTTTA